MSENMVEISVDDLEELTSSVLELDRHLGLMREVGFMVLAGKTYDDMDKEWNEDFEKDNDVDLSTEEGLSGYICFHDYFRNTTLKQSSKTMWGIRELLGITDVSNNVIKVTKVDNVDWSNYDLDPIGTDLRNGKLIATDDDIPF